MNWILLVNILILTVLLVNFIAAKLFIRTIKYEILDFFLPASEAEGSAFDKLLDVAAAKVARQASIAVKTTVGGILSGQARKGAAMDQAAAELAIDIGNPVVGGLIDMLPKKWKKRALDNPEISQMIMSKVSGMLGGNTIGSGSGSSAVSTSGSNGQKAKFNL
jgi:hypothetical protein